MYYGNMLWLKILKIQTKTQLSWHKWGNGEYILLVFLHMLDTSFHISSAINRRDMALQL